MYIDGPDSCPPQFDDPFLGAEDTLSLKLENIKDAHLHKPHHHTTEFIWMGSPWACRKKRKHYEGFTCSGVSILVHNFVYVLAEDYKQFVAYVDDLYEDSRGYKMVVVRWFYKVDEIKHLLPHSYDNKEVFFSPCFQDLSIKCIDGLATVLSPQHYENFLKADGHTKFDPFVCGNQFDSHAVKPFDITQVKGYWKQNIHGCMSLTTSNGTQLIIDHPEVVVTRPNKRPRLLVSARESSDLSGPHVEFNSNKNGKLETGDVAGYLSMQKHGYTIGSQIEVLSQDSGIRGCWFKAVVIKMHKDSLKVRYQDLKDAADESINLEEWILSSRVAAPDPLGIRLSRRMTIRPSRLSNNCDVESVDVGCIVDAWLHDGWWEGIVVRKESNDRIQVYFPGEKQRSILGCRDLRYSKEWLGGRWERMKNRRDVLGLISSVTECQSWVHHHSNDQLLAQLTWNWATKRSRYARNSSVDMMMDL